MSVEILHVRDPDGECEMSVYVDGVEVAVQSVEDIDPGRGYSRSEWDERIAVTRTSANMTPAFRKATLEALESMSDNKYIED